MSRAGAGAPSWELVTGEPLVRVVVAGAATTGGWGLGDPGAAADPADEFAAEAMEGDWLGPSLVGAC